MSAPVNRNAGGRAPRRPGPRLACRRRSGMCATCSATTSSPAISFGLFVLLLVLAGGIGPWLVPYDPLASDTVSALKAPTWRHLFGTDQLGRDILSRVVVATRLDMGIAIFSVALVFVAGGARGHRVPGSSAAGPTASSGASPTPSWRSRSSCSRWASWRRSATR